MVQLEVLFQSGQVLVLNLDSPQQATSVLAEVRHRAEVGQTGLIHVVSQQEETVINLRDVAYVRLFKDANFRIAQQHQDVQQEAATRKKFEEIAIEDEIARMKGHTP